MFLSAENIEKRFGGLVAVNKVSMEIKQGEIFGLIGPNGAGKTTFINCISGVGPPNAGKVTFKGEDVTGARPYIMAAKGMSRTFQIVRSFAKMTALENVKSGVIFGRNGRSVKDPEARAAEILDSVGFDMPMDTIAGQLNTIQLKYLELARALATGCDMLLLDEVAAGLTTGELPAFMKLIRSVRDRGVTIIAIEHVMKFIMGLSDRIAVLQFGEKIAEGTPEEIMNNPAVTEAYLGKEEVH